MPFKTGTNYGAWMMNSGAVAGWRAFCDFPDTLAVESIADYNGDGGLEWKGYGSVPSDWKTNLASQVI